MMQFSVLMAVYAKERPEFLDESLKSLVRQTMAADEVVIVRDGDLTSELMSVIEKYRAELNIVDVNLAKRSGLAVALNEGLKFCKHELILRMDSDDIALPDRFELQVSWMLKHPEISASSGIVEEFDENSSSKMYRSLPLEHATLEKFARRRSPLNHPAVIFRRPDILAVGGYPVFEKGQDYALWSLLIVNGYRLANQPNLLVKMRAGSALMKRRGFEFLLSELALIRFQKKIGALGPLDFVFNCFARAFIRLAPTSLKLAIYRLFRASAL